MVFMSDGWGALLAEIVKIVLQPKSPGLPPVPGPTPPTPRTPTTLPQQPHVAVRSLKNNEYIDPDKEERELYERLKKKYEKS